MSVRLVVSALAFLGLASAVCAFGAYTYDYSGPVTSYSMTQNGTVDAWTPAAQFYTGGSLIWNPTVSGAVSTDYEVNTTLSLAPGAGTFIEYVRASSSAQALAGGGCVGTYVSAEISEGAGYALGGAQAVLNINQCSGGSLSWVGGVWVPIINGSTFRTVVFGSNIWVFVDNQLAIMETIGIASGQPGIGGYNMAVSNGFTNLAIGHHDTVAPNVIDSTTIRSSVLPTQVSLIWQGVSDDANGIGVAAYQITRYDGTTWSYLGMRAGPSITDNSLLPGTAYSYFINGVDFHGNTASSTPFLVTTPPANSVDPRRVGIFTTGSYWGGGGEQIDMLSGNLNFSLPLLSAQGRAGWSVPVGLTYNSQNWRWDAGTNWELGTDVGYGYGWSVQIGSITPYYYGWPSGVDHYVYTDGTGAQYTLTQIGTSNIWTSMQGIYVWFDANTSTLHFKNGMFWLMGCVSSGDEQDAGTMYPTIIEDTGGNQVIVTYNGTPSLPGSPVNTSSRISTIEDIHGGGSPSYSFYYGAGPHLANIYSYLGGSPQSFTYTGSVALKPPASFGGATDPRFSSTTTVRLASIAEPAAGSYAFTYDSTGAAELLQATFPWGGCLGWDYADGDYAGNRELREVSNRYMNSSSASPSCGSGYEAPYPITHSDTGISGGIPIVHADATLADMSGNGAKKWTFNNSSGTAWQIGLVSEFDQMASVGGTVITKDTYTWSQTPTSANPYISTKVSVKDPGTGSAASAQTNQTEDQYGNATQVVVYPYNNTTTPLATYNSTYVTTSGYIAAYLRGLLASATITPGGGSPITLVTNTYDGCSGHGYATPPSYNFDIGATWTWPVRGYLSASVTPAGTSSACYYWYGVPYSSTGVDGTTTVSSVSSLTDYTMPDTVTTPTYSDALTYDSWLSLTSATGANGETMSLTYDALGRPATGTSPYGAVTTYGYTAAGVTPVQQTSSGPNGFSRTTLDGFGRAILVESGTSSGSIQSQTSTVYAPCACSPLGKIHQVSQPYAPGATEYWTTYSYDGIGRPVATTLPDTASTTTYSYAGNTTTVTDPASNYKTFTSDVSGNLTTVLEPNPAGGTFTTSYTYDWMNHLIGSSMTRGSTTQTRTFVYNSAGQLTSATNPESGTVSYAYNADTTLNTKTDAKGQVTVYTYDGAKRVTETQMYPYGLSYAEDVCQRVTYGYDAGTYGLGRLTSTAYGMPYTTYTGGSGGCPGTAAWHSYQEAYTYDPAGGVTNKTLTVYTPDSTYFTYAASIGIDYSYDSAGRISTAAYPRTTNYYYSTPPTYTYSYDGMGRMAGMTDNVINPVTGLGTPWTQNGQYDAGGRMTSLQLFDGLSWPAGYPTFVTDARTFNTNGQLTSMWSGGLTYSYSPTQNNGQITTMTDSGGTVSYTYDALKRLTGATDVSGGSTVWTQAFGYDGFGNMTSKTLNGGANSAPAVDPTTNRLTSGYDANGNMLMGYGLTATYDERNRLASATPTSGGTEYYGYAPDNKRIYRWSPTTGVEEWTFYGAKGERIGTFAWATPGSPTYGLVPTTSNVWFGGRLIDKVDTSGYLRLVVRDRVGTDREGGAKYYPYGDEITSTANDTEKYATYVRDSFTALDYADQRYYASSYGRFNTADPLAASAMASDPGSWNRYAYTRGDPVNHSDPSGMYEIANPCDNDWADCGDGPGGGDFDSWYQDDPDLDTGDDFSGPPACLTNPTFALAHPAECGVTGSSLGFAPTPTAPQCPLVGITGSYSVTHAWPVYAEFAPAMAADIDQALLILNGEGVTPQINSGYRGTASQASIPTNNPYPVAPPGQSWHNVGLAVDIQLNPNTQVGQEIIAAMESAGLTWGGTFSHADDVHFQLPGAVTHSNGTLTSGAPSQAQVAACQAAYPLGH